MQSGDLASSKEYEKSLGAELNGRVEFKCDVGKGSIETIPIADRLKVVDMAYFKRIMINAYMFDVTKKKKTWDSILH